MRELEAAHRLLGCALLGTAFWEAPARNPVGRSIISLNLSSQRHESEGPRHQPDTTAKEAEQRLCLFNIIGYDGSRVGLETGSARYF